jgi:regulator of cell morphogenesis and NO signaling
MSFTTETKVKEIALSNPQARQILEDAGVDYCCGGGKPLRDACLSAEVSADEILEQLKKNRQEVAASAANWTSAPLVELTRHIREKHHQYVRSAIPNIQALLAKVKAKHGPAHPEVAAIEELFAQIGREMIMHMQKEEQILFPYIDAVERAIKGSGSIEPPFFQTVRNPIQAMMREHDSSGDLVRQIRTASRDYTAPEEACTSFKALYEDLKRFELDLHEHVHLENNVLFPRAVEAEAAVL